MGFFKRAATKGAYRAAAAAYRSPVMRNQRDLNAWLTENAAANRRSGVDRDRPETMAQYLIAKRRWNKER